MLLQPAIRRCDVITVWPFSCRLPVAWCLNTVIAASKCEWEAFSPGERRGGVTIVGMYNSGRRTYHKNCLLLCVYLPHSEMSFVLFECHYVRANKSVTAYSNLAKKDPSFPYFREKNSTQTADHTRVNIMRNTMCLATKTVWLDYMF